MSGDNTKKMWRTISDRLKNYEVVEVERMNKSIEFVKNRIKSGQCNGMENNDYDNMFEISSIETAKDMFGDLKWEDNTAYLNLVSDVEDGIKEVKRVCYTIKHDPDAEFEYFTMESCCCDGTMLFFAELEQKILMKVFLGNTYCNTKAPKDIKTNFWNYNRIYTIGNCVLATEYGKEFTTDDKPWMKSRFTVMLPVKCEFVPKLEGKEIGEHEM